MSRAPLSVRHESYPDTSRQLQDMDLDSEDLPNLEGIHKGVILTDTWGNEWDDTGDFGEIDFRTVDNDY